MAGVVNATKFSSGGRGDEVLVAAVLGAPRLQGRGPDLRGQELCGDMSPSPWPRAARTDVRICAGPADLVAVALRVDVTYTMRETSEVYDA
jgi:hypothetical protein